MAQYSFRAKLWEYDGKGAWIFVTVPKTLSNKIRKLHGHSEEGWGRLKTVAQTGKTNWNTAIWFDSKTGCYLLPVKAIVRKAEKIEIGDLATIKLLFQKMIRKSKLTPRLFSD